MLVPELELFDVVSLAFLVTALELTGELAFCSKRSQSTFNGVDVCDVVNEWGESEGCCEMDATLDDSTGVTAFDGTVDDKDEIAVGDVVACEEVAAELT